MKKVLNIVFYEKTENKEKRAKVFYSNGEIEDVNYDSALKICLQFINENNIKTMEEFKNILNNELIYVKTEEDLNKNLDLYTSNIEEAPSIEEIDKEIQEEQERIVEESKDLSKEEQTQEDEIEEENYDIDSPQNIEDDDEEVVDINKLHDNSDKEIEEELEEKENKENKKQEKQKKEEPKTEYKGVKGFFKKIKDKLIKNKVVRRIVLVVTALAVGLGIYSAASRKSLEGKIATNNITTISDSNNPKSNNKDDLLIIGDNSYYNDYDYETLSKVTTAEKQKTTMNNILETLKNYNGKFAAAYQEKNIKPALSFDEISSLQAAYNNYSKDDIKKIFNGAEIKSKDLENNYKSASLQLMGAYIIETKQNPVDISLLIDSKEGKAFYDKYHKLFINAKYAKDEEQIEAVKKFYEEVKKDFPITPDKRTEGISHADNYESIESYKLSVTPMIAAAEMIFQNLKIDNTLKDSEIDFINDIGLCNYAKDNFNKIETVLLVSESNNEEPLYSQYKNVIEKMMKEKNMYVIDDAHRELSKLQVFQLAVNGHFNQVITGNFKCNTTVTTYEDTNTTYREEITTKELPIPAEEKAKIDQKINEENKSAKAKGEAAAESNRRKMQEDADSDAKQIKQDIANNNNDLQNKINEANNKINNGQTVNENDFGNHNVKFDDNHSDGNGNLDNSVTDITTDGNGANNGNLPDPNETGKKFDSAPIGYSNEEFADQYIEQIAENSKQEEKPFQYKK